jgi:hypothetical protein
MEMKRQWEVHNEEEVHQPKWFTEEAVHTDIRVRVKHYIAARHDVIATRLGNKDWVLGVYNRLSQAQLVSIIFTDKK